MAALSRRTEATYEVHETIKVDTQDNEDHTFCGIMFPIKCKDMLPIDHIIIRSISVRGQLGPMTVWVSKPQQNNGRSTRNQNQNINNHTFRLSKSQWIKLYEREHGPSQTTYQTLFLDEPIRLKPGEVRAIYIHSTLPGDQAIVYDNASFYLPHRGAHLQQAAHVRKPRYDDSMISIFTGRAHVSNTAFGQMPIWGWGNAWRDHREFVGQMEYGAVYQLWNPETRNLFGPQFHKATQLLFLCQRKWESPMSMLPDECIFYILNMCRWDWFEDSAQTMTVQQHRRLARDRAEREQAAANAAAEAEALANQLGNDNGNHEGSDDDDDDDDENYVDAVEDEHEEEEDEEDHDDDEDLMDESEGDDDDDDEEEDDDDESWEAANGYRADHNVFQFVDTTNEEDEQERVEESSSPARQAWVRRQFARIQILRALARDDDEEDGAGVMDMHVAS